MPDRSKKAGNDDGYDLLYRGPYERGSWEDSASIGRLKRADLNQKYLRQATSPEPPNAGRLHHSAQGGTDSNLRRFLRTRRSRCGRPRG